MSSASAIEVIKGDLNELSYLFPASMVAISTCWDEKKLFFAKIGSIPYGAFVFVFPHFNERLKCQVVDIPYLSVLPSLISNQLVEDSLSFIVNFLSLDPSNVIFNLSLNFEFPLLVNLGSSKVEYLHRWTIKEVKLDFRKSPAHWMHLWKLFERNYNYLSHSYDLQTIPLSSLDHSFLSDYPQGQMPDWANPYNIGFHSPTNNSCNLVLLLDKSPIAWVNAGIFNQTLLFENLWCFPHIHSAQFSYILLYNLFTIFNDYQLTVPRFTCLFSYREENNGMDKLTHRLNPFISLVTSVHKVQARIIKK